MIIFLFIKMIKKIVKKKTLTEKGYYFKDNLFYPCDENCLTCSEGKNNYSNNCLSCKHDQYLVEDLNNCEYRNYSGYYLDNNDSKLKKCYNTCETCNGAFEYDENSNKENQNCDKCIEGYHLKNGTKNCYNDTILEYGYYLSKNDSFYYPCSIQCLTCSEKNKCIKCNTKDGYYSIYEEELENNCYNNNTIEKGYFLDNQTYPYKWRKCYEKCDTCNLIGNETNMNCISCNKNLEEDLFLTEEGNCVYFCPNGTFQFNLNLTCLKSCPQNYEINEEKNECVKITVKQTSSSSDFKNIFLNNITSFLNSPSVINGSDFIAAVLSSDDIDPEEQLKKGISAIDLGNCTQEIKDFYNLSKDESFIILNMESKKNETKDEENNKNDKSFDIGKNTQIEIYDNSGRKLNLSVCEEEIKVMKYIGDIEQLDLNSAMNLANKGVDIFNSNDDFFNDICQKYDNTDGKDIIIEDRRKEIFKDVSFCQTGCTYTGMNYEFKAANCICDSSTIQNDLEENNYNNITEESEVNFKAITKSFMHNFLDFNSQVFKCYNLVFDSNSLKNNVGFYLMLIMLLIQIIIIIIYIFKKLKSIRNFMIIFKKNDPNEMNTLFQTNNVTNNIDNNRERKIIENQKENGHKKKYLKDKKEKKKEKHKKRKIEINKVNNNETENENNNRRKICFKENGSVFQKNSIENKKNLNIFLNNKNDNNIKERNFNFLNNCTSIFNKQTSILNINKKNNKSKIVQDKQLNSKKINRKNKQDKKDNKKNNNKTIKNANNKKTNKEKNKHIRYKKNFNLSPTDEDLKDMEYEKAINYDKRTYMRMCWFFLINSQIILGTFCTNNYLHLLIIKISFLVCTFQISFFLNAFFYTDKYISNAYHNDGVLDFITGLPKSINSSVATMIITNL